MHIADEGAICSPIHQYSPKDCARELHCLGERVSSSCLDLFVFFFNSSFNNNKKRNTRIIEVYQHSLGAALSERVNFILLSSIIEGKKFATFSISNLWRNIERIEKFLDAHRHSLCAALMNCSVEYNIVINNEGRLISIGSK